MQTSGTFPQLYDGRSKSKRAKGKLTGQTAMSSTPRTPTNRPKSLAQARAMSKGKCK